MRKIKDAIIWPVDVDINFVTSVEQDGPIHMYVSNWWDNLMFLTDGLVAVFNVMNVTFAGHWITVVNACVLMTGRFVR